MLLAKLCLLLCASLENWMLVLAYHRSVGYHWPNDNEKYVFFHLLLPKFCAVYLFN